MNTLNKRILSARERKGLTQKALADAAGTTMGTISKLESGAQRGSSTLPRIAEVLGVSEEWLISGVGDGVPSWYHVQQVRSAPEEYNAGPYPGGRAPRISQEALIFDLMSRIADLQAQMSEIKLMIETKGADNAGGK